MLYSVPLLPESFTADAEADADAKTKTFPAESQLLPTEFQLIYGDRRGRTGEGGRARAEGRANNPKQEHDAASVPCIATHTQHMIL